MIVIIYDIIELKCKIYVGCVFMGVVLLSEIVYWQDIQSNHCAE